jgi:hypothetical protein
MTKIIHGKIHGRMIELDEDLGLTEGQEVKVSVQVISKDPRRKPGDGLLRCAGALANEWTDEDDRILAEIHEERKHDPRREIKG